MPELIRIGGLELRFLRDKHDTHGSLDMFEMTVPPRRPNARRPPPPRLGRVRLRPGRHRHLHRGRPPHPIQPGETLFIPRGTVHGFHNDSGAPARCLCVLTPGVLGPEYFRELAALIAKGSPDEAAVQEIMLRHGLIPAGSPKPP